MLFYRRPASIAQCPPGSAGWTRRVESEKGEKSLLVAPRHSPAPRSMPSDPSRAREEGDATYFERLEERERRRTCAIQVGTRRATPRPLLDRGRGCRAGATIRVNIPHPRPPRPPLSQQSIIAAVILSATFYVVASAFWQVSARRNLADGAVAAPTG